MAKLVVSAAAERDYEEAYDRYRAKSHRAAENFEREIIRAFHAIADSPDRWPHYDDEVHRFFILKKYPYFIVYRVDENAVRVEAIAHGHRRPEYWKSR